MTRAAPLPPDERREAIMDATLPLLLEEGLGTSSRRIAEAAGVAEGTIYRVFHTKHELISAVVQRALSPHAFVEAVAALPPETDLRALVVDLTRSIQASALTTRRLLALLPPQPDDLHGPGDGGRHFGGEAIMATIADALQPHADQLAVGSRAAAGTILAMGLGSSFALGNPDPEHVAQVILHGISRPDRKASPC